MSSFGFIKLALDKPSRIDIGDTITLIWGPVSLNCSFLSSLSFAKNRSTVCVFSLELLIISMQSLLRLHKHHVEIIKMIASLFSSVLLLFELFFIIIQRLH